MTDRRKGQRQNLLHIIALPLNWNVTHLAIDYLFFLQGVAVYSSVPSYWLLQCFAHLRLGALCDQYGIRMQHVHRLRGNSLPLLPLQLSPRTEGPQTNPPTRVFHLQQGGTRVLRQLLQRMRSTCSCPSAMKPPLTIMLSNSVTRDPYLVQHSTRTRDEMMYSLYKMPDNPKWMSRKFKKPVATSGRCYLGVADSWARHSFIGLSGGEIFHEMMLRQGVKHVCTST